MRHGWRPIRYVLALLLLGSALSAQASFSFREDVAAATGVTIHLDFFPETFTGLNQIPISTPAALGDLVVSVAPLSPKSSLNFGSQVAAAINAGFRGNDAFSGYSADVRRSLSPEGKTYDATIQISSPVSLKGAFITCPVVMGPPTMACRLGLTGIAFQPTAADISARVNLAHPGAPNAQMRIGGVDPAIDGLHRSEVLTGSPFAISFSSGTNSNAGIVLAVSSVYNPRNFVLPGIGSLDIGLPGFVDLTVAYDGIGLTVNPIVSTFFNTGTAGVFNFTVPTPASMAGQHMAMQAVLTDVTAPPLFLALTQASDVEFAAGQLATLATGDDGFVPVTFSAGSTFDFYGVTYSQAFVHADGFVTFGGPSGLTSTGIIDPQAALSQQPAIFVNWSNWSPGTTVGGVLLREFGAKARFQWGSAAAPVSHAGLGDQAVFGCTLVLNAAPGSTPPSQSESIDQLVANLVPNAGTLFLDYDQLSLAPGGTLSDFDDLIGISPGLVPAPAAVPSLDLREAIELPMGPVPLVSQDDASVTASSSLLANGAAQRYRNGLSLRGGVIGFHPVLAGGVTGYTTSSTDAKPDDVRGADAAVVHRLLPTILTLTGQFRFLFHGNGSAVNPTVTIVGNNSGATANVSMLILMGTGGGSGGIPVAPPAPGYRNWEGLVVSVPPLTGFLLGETATMTVTFASGTAFPVATTFAVLL